MGSTITIDFHGDTLAAVLDDSGPYVPLQPLVSGMGLDWGSQLKRLKRDPILSGSMVMMTTESDRQAVCLPLDLVPGFLFRIDAGRVAEAARPKVVEYQRECFRVLAAACLGRAAPTAPEHPPAPLSLLTTDAARKLVAECRQTFGPISARELWRAVGLPLVPSMEPLPDLFTYRREA